MRVAPLQFKMEPKRGQLTLFGAVSGAKEVCSAPCLLLLSIVLWTWMCLTAALCLLLLLLVPTNLRRCHLQVPTGAVAPTCSVPTPDEVAPINFACACIGVFVFVSAPCCMSLHCCLHLLS